MSASKSVWSRRRTRASITRDSLSQSTPWWTTTSCAPAAAARSKSSSDDETAQTTRDTSAAPSTCIPCGP